MAKQSSLRPWLIVAIFIALSVFVPMLIGGEDLGAAFITSIGIGIAGSAVLAFIFFAISDWGK